MDHPPLFAFFGTPRFAVDVLDALEKNGMVPAVVITAPDRPRGRGLEVTPSPAKAWALERGIDVLEPATLKDEQFIADLKNTDWDVFIVAAYAKLIPQAVLDIPRRGCLNVHPSLLPKFRGPSPARSAILADERTTGVSIMQMNAAMDAGPIVAQGRIVLEEETPEAPGWPPQGELFEQLLATEGGNLLAETLPQWIAGAIAAEPQDESQATFTKKFTTEDALVDLAGDARQQLLKIRALDKNPRAYFIDEAGKRIGITEAALEDGKLVIKKVVPEGKREMGFEDYQRGSVN
ncbi:MAG: Methionyl-tRNA formyltransferase [Candidatus Adlerbacteria bacterium]|nr:Methionyl-tRNA formyltransferase [Candidatus Adlerbacteria bacterium]